jgi:hypothetical protein
MNSGRIPEVPGQPEIRLKKNEIDALEQLLENNKTLFD